MTVPRAFPSFVWLILSVLFVYSPLARIDAFASPTEHTSDGNPFSTDSTVVHPRIINRVNPIYPEEAREARLEATTILQVTIRKDGTTKLTNKSCFSCRVNRVGSRPERVLRGWCEDFCESSIEAVSQWLYEPGTQVGEPVDVYFTAVVDYTLE